MATNNSRGGKERDIEGGRGKGEGGGGGRNDINRTIGLKFLPPEAIWPSLLGPTFYPL